MAVRFILSFCYSSVQFYGNRQTVMVSPEFIEEFTQKNALRVKGGTKATMCAFVSFKRESNAEF